MSAVGIDLGGTKIETQIFDDSWSVVSRQRQDTPRSYPELVQAMADQISWGLAQSQMRRWAWGQQGSSIRRTALRYGQFASHRHPTDIAAKIGRLDICE